MPIGASSAPYAKFTAPGQRHGGEIVDFRVVQTVDFDTKRPLYFVDGSRGFEPYDGDGNPNQPICQWEITVETGEEDENGDTERRIFVDPRRGKKNTLLEGKRGGDAVANALKKAKAHRVGLEIGAKFWLISGDKVRDGSGPATNTWTAEYEPPPGGPGTGKPVDEIPHMVGGGRYNPADRAPTPAADTSATDADHATRVQEVTDQLGRAHDSSPVLNRKNAYDDSPPF